MSALGMCLYYKDGHVLFYGEEKGIGLKKRKRIMVRCHWYKSISLLTFKWKAQISLPYTYYHIF